MDKEVSEGYVRSRFRDLEPNNLTDLDNKAYARYISAAPVTPLGHTEMTANTTPAGLPSIPANCKRVVLVANDTTNGFTYTDDGSTPSGAHGIPIPPSTVFIYDTEPDANFQIWASTAVDVRIAFYG